MKVTVKVSPKKKINKYRSQSERAYSQELDKQWVVVNGAAVALFKAYYNWSDARTMRIFAETANIWRAIHADAKIVEIMYLLEDETGMVLTLKGKSWKDVDVFQEGYEETVTTYTRLDYLFDILKPWIANGIIASILIALHRLEGWGNRKNFRSFWKISMVLEVSAEMPIITICC